MPRVASRIAGRHRFALCCALLAGCSTTDPGPVPAPSDATPVRDRAPVAFGDAGAMDAMGDRPSTPDGDPLDAQPHDALPPKPDAPQVPCTLTEGSATKWTSGCVPLPDKPCTPSLTDDAQTRQDGQTALRWRCDGCGFDSWIAYAAPTAGWNLAGYDYLQLWFRTVLDEAPHSWQSGVYGHPPWIILRDRGGRTKRIGPDVPGALLDGSVGKWLLVSVPLGVATGWKSATDTGFSSDDVTSLEIHVDPWGAGFTLWLDGATFGPGVFSGCR